MWFRKDKGPRAPRDPKTSASLGEGLFLKCEGCRETLYLKELERLKVSKDDDSTRLEKLPAAEQPSTEEDWWQAGEEVRQSLRLQPKSHWSTLLEKQPANPHDLTEYYRSLVKYDGQKRAVVA